MNQIKALLLDVGQVLVTLDLDAPRREVTRRSKLPAAEIQTRWRSSAIMTLYEEGKLTTPEFYNSVKAMLELEDVDLDTFRRGWGTVFVFPGGEGQCISPPFFRELKRRYRMVAVSNTNDLHWTYLETVLPLLAEFDDLVLSHRVGAMKPNPLIYRSALERAECRRDEALFVDDLETNVEAAVQLGINGLLYRNEAQFRADLIRLRLLD